MLSHPRRWTASVLLAACALLVVAKDDSDIKAVPLRTHSLQLPYVDHDMQSRWWDYGGSTVMRTDQYVRLTSEQPSQAGWVFSRIPLTATNWEVEFEFKIHGSLSLFGDGLAMWLTKDRAEQGNVFGMKDRFEGLGIFFDTYKNNRPGTVFPYIMAMVGDGRTTYDRAHDGKDNELAGCSARGLRNADIPTKARVTFFQDKELTLDLQYKNEGEWTRCFQVEGVKLPSVTYLGFSAETGELSDKHDIIRVDTKNLYSATGSTDRAAGSKEYSRNKGRPRDATEGGGWFWFLMRIVLFALLVVVAYAGFTIYRTRRRNKF